MSKEEENKAITTKIQEITESVSGQRIDEFSRSEQHNSSSVTFQTENGSQISLNSQTHLLSSTAFSSEIITVTKKTTTKTTTTFYSTNRKFPTTYQNTKLKKSKVSGYLSYDKLKFDQQIFDRQASIIDSLTPYTNDKPEILTKTAEFAQKLPESESSLKNSLNQVVASNDPLNLAPLETDILNSYQNVIGSSEDSTGLLNYYLELLCYISTFPKTRFCPLDASVRARDVASTLDQSDPLQNSLLIISNTLDADFIYRKTQTYVDSYLSKTSNIYVQKVRWLVKNIQDELIVDDPSNAKLTIERNIETPVLPEGTSVVRPRSIESIIKKAHTYSEEILQNLSEVSPEEEDAETWYVYLNDINEALKELEENPSHEKICSKKDLFINAVPKLEKFVPFCGIADSKVTAQKLSKKLKVISKYVTYVDRYGNITYFTIDSALSDAQDAMAKRIATSGLPDEVARNSLFNASLTKMRATLAHPGVNQGEFDSASESINSFLSVTEDKDVASYLQIVQWELACPNLYRSTVISALKSTVDSYQQCSQKLQETKSSITDEKLKSDAEAWNGTISKNVESINAMINSLNPADPPHADQLIEMRSSFTPINDKRNELGFDPESRLLARNIDRSITLIKGERYIHKQLPPPGSPQTPTMKRKQSFGRVQFASEGHSKDQLKDLYPKKAFNHPIYQSWDPKKFAELIKTNKPVPLDISMLSKITTSKLTSSRSRSRSRNKTGTQSGVLNFKLYQVPEPSKIDTEYYKNKDEAEIQAAYEATEKSVSNIENNIFRINKKSLFDKYDFVENSAPGLQNPCFKNDEKLKSRYSKVYKKFNDLIVGLLSEPLLLLPRQAVDRVDKYLKCICDTLVFYRSKETVINDKQGYSLCEKWYDYLSDSLRIIDIISNADDEVAIATGHQFFLNFRSGLASFTTPAEKLDELTSRRSLSSLITTTLRTMLTIIQFNQYVQYDEYCTVQSAQNQLDELTQKFKDSQVALQTKKSYEQTKNQVRQIISASDVNTSTADSAAQLLREVHVSLENDIRTPDDEEMTLFLSTIGVRLSIINLHVTDAGPDPKLSELTSTVATDFDNLIEQVKAGEGGDQEVVDLSKSWQQHLDVCQRDVNAMNSVSPIASQSYSRYSTIAGNAEDIYNSLTILEDKRFPFSVSTYSKLSLHLEKLLDYVKSKRRGKQTRGRKQSELTSVLQKHILSLQSAKKTQQVTDNYFDEFANGFIDVDTQQTRDIISNNISQSLDNKNSRDYKVSRLLGKLFAAHIGSFSRNYNISSKSTRVCYELLNEYSKSIQECGECAPLALQSSSDYKKLKKLVSHHVESIQEIQNQYNDKNVYSDHARQRIIIFAHFCSISSQLTMLNINHLKIQQDEPFDFDDINVHSRAANQLLDDPSYKTASQTLFSELNDIQSVSKYVDQNDNENTLPIIEILETEKRYAESLSELVELLMLETDVRYWKVNDREVKLTPMNEEISNGAEEKASAADLKRSIDLVTENLTHFKSTLQDEDISEEELLQQIDGLDATVKVFCDSANTIEADSGFTKLVHKFRQDTIRLCNYLRTELQNGTYTLYSREASMRLNDANQSALSIIRQLGYMEMLEDEENDISAVLTRLIKQLLLQRDNFKEAAKKQKEGSDDQSEALLVQNRSAVIPQYAEFSGDSFDTVANVLLTIKNSDPMVLKALYTKDVSSLRRIIFVTQELIDEGADLENCIQRTAEYPVESPEFLVKSRFEPIVNDLRKFRNSIDESIPNSGYLAQCISSVISKMNIIIEPHFEDRPLIDMAQQ